MGNVGEDPKVNQVNDTLNVTRFPLATNDAYFDKEGNEVQKTEWHQLVFWNKAADIVGAYVRKGIPLYVEGKIQSCTGKQHGLRSRIVTSGYCISILLSNIDFYVTIN